MKKIFLVMIISILVLSLVSADLKVEPQADNVAMILGLGQPAVFDLKITNLGSTDSFIFYNYFGSDTFPKGTVTFGVGETKNVQVGIYPRDDLKQEGWMKFDLFIKGADDEKSYPLMVDVIRLKDAFEVGAEEFKPDSNKVTVYIKNRVNFNFNNIVAKFQSPFFDFDKAFSLKPMEKKSFEISLNKEDFRDLMAGFYTLNVEVTADSQKVNTQGTIKFSEEDIVTSSENQYGVIINTNRITKTNEGNTVSPTVTVIRKNII